MYFPFFKPQTGGKRSAIQPQTIYSEFPKEKNEKSPFRRIRNGEKDCLV